MIYVRRKSAKSRGKWPLACFQAIKHFFLKNKIILFDYHLFAHCVILDKLQTCMREMVGRRSRWKASVRKKTPAKRILLTVCLKNNSSQQHPLGRKTFFSKENVVHNRRTEFFFRWVLRQVTRKVTSYAISAFSHWKKFDKVASHHFLERRKNWNSTNLTCLLHY